MRPVFISPEGVLLEHKVNAPTPEVTHEAWSIDELSRLAFGEAEKASTKLKHSKDTPHV